MFDELEIVEKIGNLLQGQPGLAGQIGWGLLAVLGAYKIFTSVGLGKMTWGEAGTKLEELFKNFQWRFEGKEDGKDADVIKVIGLDGNTVYSYADGTFYLSSGNQFSPIHQLLSRKEKKKLSKLRKQVVNQMSATYKANSAAAIAAQVEAFLQPAVKNSDNIPDIRKTLPVAKVVEAPKPVVVAPAPRPVVQAPVVAKVEPVKVVVACPKCRTNRAIIVAGTVAPNCPECKVGKDKNVNVKMQETTADPKEFIAQNSGWTPAIANGTVFKNFESTNGKFVAQPWYQPKVAGFEVRKQPSEAFKDQATVAVYKELKAKEKEAKKAQEVAAKKVEENKVVPANKLFAADAASQQVRNVVEAPKPVVAPVVAKVEEKKPEVKSDYAVYCCPKCRITRAIVKIGTDAAMVCKNDDCNGEKLVLTTGKAEEFVMEDGQKVTDYLKAKNLTSVRFRNYGSEKGDKFVAVLLPMKNAPLHNGVKMTAKKQPSESIVGYVKKAKKEEAKPVDGKVVTEKSKVSVEYVSGNYKNSKIWDFAGQEGINSWKNVREMMKGMKVGETRIIPACNDGTSNNSQIKVTVNAIA